MLRVVEPVPALNASERFALSTLLDLSRVLVADSDASATLEIAGPAGSATIPECRAANWGILAVSGVVTLKRSVLGLVAGIAGAVAEQRSSAEDRHGRVPPAVNALVAAGMEREPLVHHAARALRDAASDAANGCFALLAPWPEGKRWAVAMSHDLDVVSMWPAFTALRVAELLKKGEVGRATHVLASAGRAALGNPIYDSAKNVIDVERAHGVRSTWFIITGTPTITTVAAGDVTYTPEAPQARRIISLAADTGNEIGLHGSFKTYVTASAFDAQRRRLQAITGREIAGVRQHFLRMRPGMTHRAMVEAGFQYDSTFGFPDRNGFRLGIGDVVPVWDEARQEVLSIDEVPFLWMDRALSKYRGVEVPGEWVRDGLEIATICREIEGVWNGIWHPNLAPALGFPAAPGALIDLVQQLTERQPWSAGMSEIVRWRRARRTAGAAGLDAAGSVRLRASDPRIVLEDRMGKTLASVPA